MKKIKILVLFLIVVLLCQNISFCIPEASFALRPPLVTNKTDFVVLSEFKIDIGRDLEEQGQSIDSFLGNNLSNLTLSAVSIYPYILYENIILSMSSIKNRFGLFVYAVDELKKNLIDHSDGNGSELCIQLGNHKEIGLAIRAVSRNKENIEGLIGILDGVKIRRGTKENSGYKGVGLIVLKELAFNNQGIVFIIDSNGNKISVSEGSITSSRGIYPGTEVQMIISIPSQLEECFVGCIERIKYPRNSI